MKNKKVKNNPKDECYCGDYRDQHQDSKGICQVFNCGTDVQWPRCKKFKLVLRAGERNE